MVINNKLKILALISVCIFIATLWNKKRIAGNLQSAAQLHSEKIILSNESETGKDLSLPTTSSTSLANEVIASIADSAVGLDAISNKKIEENITEDDLVEKAESFNQWLLRSSEVSTDFNFSDEMKKQFEQENIDIYWAADQENILQTLFVDNQELAGIALTDVKCRTTQCQLTIAITDIDQANQLVGQIDKALIKQGYKDLMVIAAPEEKGNITRLYIGNQQWLPNMN